MGKKKNANRTSKADRMRSIQAQMESNMNMIRDEVTSVEWNMKDKARLDNIRADKTLVYLASRQAFP
jgi:hypothetical protein